MLHDVRTKRHLVLSFTLGATLLVGAGCSAPDAASTRQVSSGDVQDEFLQWPLPPGAEQYADIDGRRMHEYVVEQAEIARTYRDQGHPKFWGRIIGASSDTESAEWLADKFRGLGLSDVRIQPLDLLPQWFPQTYRVTVRSGNETLVLESAQPAYRTTGTPPGGLELEGAYAGMGSAADYVGRNVRGKAVFSYAMLGMADSRQEDAVARADSNGAAAIFNVHMLPGNYT